MLVLFTMKGWEGQSLTLKLFLAGAPKKVRIDEEDQEYIGEIIELCLQLQYWYLSHHPDTSTLLRALTFLLFVSAMNGYMHRCMWRWTSGDEDSSIRNRRVFKGFETAASPLQLFSDSQEWSPRHGGVRHVQVGLELSYGEFSPSRFRSHQVHSIWMLCMHWLYNTR